MDVLGISCFYHDSAAALIRDGRILAAAQEERFTRRKHDPSFPANAIRCCLEEARILPEELDGVVFYDHPMLTFDRLANNFFQTAPQGCRSWLRAASRWLTTKLAAPRIIQEHLGLDLPIQTVQHHLAHAASAFYPSPFEEAAILTVDGVGEWATTTLGRGSGNRIDLSHEIRFPHSLGLLYSAFTGFCGFKVNSGEYKLMGLAPYGHPRYVEKILDNLIEVYDDGSFRLNMKYFDYLAGFTMTNRRFADLFGGPAREPESKITQREMDLAASIQQVTQDCLLKMARHLKKETGARHLCLAGGVALNCVANGLLHKEGLFERIWVQPAAGDAGGALGAALAFYYGFEKNRRRASGPSDAMNRAYLGPAFSKEELGAFLDSFDYPYHYLAEVERAGTIARAAAEGKIVGFFSGRMEYGPRALGARSILGDARSEKTQSTMNLKIKYRESFRPFAPIVLAERAADYFDFEAESPYMLFVAPVREERRLAQPAAGNGNLIEVVNQKRSDIPAVTHVDYSARLQTVSAENGPIYEVLKKFDELTGCAVMVNTSFNVRGEPIVCTPSDAYRCFMRTEMDALYLDGFWLLKEEQPQWHEREDWRDELQLD